MITEYAFREFDVQRITIREVYVLEMIKNPKK